MYARNGTCPNYVVHIDILSEEVLLSFVYIDDTDKVLQVMSEKISECTVLTERISVGRIVERTVAVAEYQNDTSFDIFHELLASHHVSLFAEHNLSLFL